MWRSGTDESCRWLAHGNFPQEHKSLIFIRPRQTRGIEIRLRLAQLDATVGMGAEEIPRHARFSIDAGEESQMGLNGIGFIVQTDDGRVVFTTGSGTYGENLAIFHPILAQVSDQIGLLVEGEAYDFSIDPANKRILDSLFDVPILKLV